MTGRQSWGGGASRTTDPAAGSSAATDVSLREYFNEKIENDRQVARERFTFVAVVGGVIWFFIERHLTDLNHENVRIATVSENSVSSDTYAANEQQRKAEQRDLGEWRKEVDKDRTQSVSRDEFNRDTKVEKRAGVSSDWQRVAGIVGILLAVLALVTFSFSLGLRHISNTPATVTVTVPTGTTTKGATPP